MKMQDNEFDELFRSRLESFEAEPSANVWEKVDDELNSHKRKKILMPVLSIAASIIVLVTAGILFIPQKGNVKPDNRRVNNRVAKIQPHLSTSHNISNQSDQIVLKSRTPHKLNTTSKNSIAAASVKSSKSNLTDKSLNVVQDKIDEHTLASNPQTQQNTIKAVVPDERTQIAINPHIEETTSFIAKPAIIATEPSIIDKQDVIPLKSKHKIHSLGDLINVVVAKVDKRKDKIIEFTDTDDESNITGINLGIIKIKKEK